MPQDYRIVVLNAYQQLKLEGRLSSNLINVTPGKLREECLIVCRERYSPSDHEILRLFFINGDRENGYLSVLANTPAEKFKQAAKVLNGKVEKPGIKYFELIAWLIDFKFKTSTAYYKSFYEDQETHKPTDEENPNADSVSSEEQNPNKKNSTSTTKEHKAEILISNPPQEKKDKSADSPSVPVSPEIDTQEGKPDEARVGEKNTADNTNTVGEKENGANGKSTDDSGKKIGLTQKFLISIAILVIIASSALLFRQDQIDRETITTDEKCMYWTGNRYEAINCNKETSTPKTTLNVQRLIKLKKISSPDQLTKEDLGKVWYAKIYGKVEFYTDSGKHPVDTNRVLKPLTSYMLSKHVSYYRYLFNSSVWIAVIILLSALLATLAVKYLAKRKKGRYPG
jgi:hypothetical protein